MFVQKPWVLVRLGQCLKCPVQRWLLIGFLKRFQNVFWFPKPHLASAVRACVLLLSLLARADAAMQMQCCALCWRLGPKAPLRRDQRASAPSSICLDLETDGVNLWTMVCFSLALSLLSALLVWGTVSCSHCPSFAASAAWAVGQGRGSERSFFPQSLTPLHAGDAGKAFWYQCRGCQRCW